MWKERKSKRKAELVSACRTESANLELTADDVNALWWQISAASRTRCPKMSSYFALDRFDIVCYRPCTRIAKENAWSGCGSMKGNRTDVQKYPTSHLFWCAWRLLPLFLEVVVFFCFTIPSLTKRARVSLANFLLTLNKRALSCLHAFAIIIAGSVSRPAPSQGIIINRLFADCLPFPPPRLARANERTIAPPYACRTLFTTPLLTIFLLLSHYLVYKG